MSDPIPLTQAQAADIRDRIAPLGDFLTRVAKRLRAIGYDESSPLLDDVVIASQRIRHLWRRLEEMTDPVKGEEFRIQAATPRRRIQPWTMDERTAGDMTVVTRGSAMPKTTQTELIQ